VFALGQVYVLASRCTDPQNFSLIGLPPKDLLEDVYAAWQRAGKDAEAVLRKNLTVTREPFSFSSLLFNFIHIFACDDV
jgi:hypothetical protein